MNGPLCRPAISHWFDADADNRHQGLAVAICARCPITDMCLELGQQAKETGIFGGRRLVDGRPRRKRGPKPLQEVA